MSPEDWRRPSIASLGFALGGDAHPDDRRARRAAHRRQPPRPHERAPRAGLVPLAGRRTVRGVERRARHGGPEPRARAGPSRAITRWRAAPLVVLRQPLAAQVARDAAAAACSRQQARGPASPAAGRRRHPAVLDPLVVGLGARRDPRSRRASPRGRAQAGFSVVQVLPVNETSGVDASPYGAALGLRARSRLSLARRVRGLRRRRRPRRALARTEGRCSPRP